MNLVVEYVVVVAALLVALPADEDFEIVDAFEVVNAKELAV
jgi:hypothetical protein